MSPVPLHAVVPSVFCAWNAKARRPREYDPRDPAEGIMKHGFGGAALFALRLQVPSERVWSFLRRNLDGAA